jgi:hypothetical protein
MLAREAACLLALKTLNIQGDTDVLLHLSARAEGLGIDGFVLISCGNRNYEQTQNHKADIYYPMKIRASKHMFLPSAATVTTNLLLQYDLDFIGPCMTGN